VKAGKAYISSLGTTGLLIASSVLLLLVGGTLVAFDRWPDGWGGDAEVVAVGEENSAVRVREVAAERRRATRARVAERRRRAAEVQRRRARAKAAAARSSDGRWAHSAPLADPVISDLPAPDADGTPGGSSGGPGGDATGGGSGGGASGGGSGGGGETTRQLGNAISNVSPQAGSAIGDVGSALDQSVGATAPSLAP
jgi:hypothetical protein